MAVSYNSIGWMACYEYNIGNNFGEGLNAATILVDR